MKYEGHPFLWYFLLMPFAKLGIAVEVQNWISALFAIFTAYIILKKAPFRKGLKILLVFSGGMIYFYSVLARPYCMIPFLLVLLASCYQKKREHPYKYAILVALLANTHLIMMPTVILLILDFWGKEILWNRGNQKEEESKKFCNSFLIAIMGVLIFSLIVIFASENCEIIGNFDETNYLKEPDKLFNLLKVTYFDTIGYLYGNIAVPLYYKIMVTIVLVLCLIGSKNDIKQAVLFWSQLVFTFLIHTLVWFILPTRVFMMIYTLMFWFWNSLEESKIQEKKKNRWIEIALILLMILSIPSTYKLALQDITQNFSTGKMMAEYIEENIPEGACFIYTEQELQQSVLAYLPKGKYQLYMPNAKEFVTYTTWNKQWLKPIRYSQIQEAIQKLRLEYQELYLINGRQMLGENNLELLFSTEGELMDNFYVRHEIFYIYKIN